MPRNDASWLQQPCLFLIFREAFQNPALLNKTMKVLLVLEEKTPQKSTKYRCYLQKNCLVLSHNSIIFVTDAYERRTQTWSTGIFVKWHALLPPPQCSGHFCLAARMFFVFFFSPMLVLKKETSLLNKNNPKTFSTVLKYSKGYQPTLWIKKKKRLNKSKDRFNAKNTEEKNARFHYFLKLYRETHSNGTGVPKANEATEQKKGKRKKSLLLP